MAETDWEAVVANIHRELNDKIKEKRGFTASVERQLARACIDNKDGEVESLKKRIAILDAELLVFEECFNLIGDHRNGSRGFPEK